MFVTLVDGKVSSRFAKTLSTLLQMTDEQIASAERTIDFLEIETIDLVYRTRFYLNFDF